jgi:hypothetical protein
MGAARLFCALPDALTVESVFIITFPVSATPRRMQRELRKRRLMWPQSPVREGIWVSLDWQT